MTASINVLGRYAGNWKHSDIDVKLEANFETNRNGGVTMENRRKTTKMNHRNLGFVRTIIGVSILASLLNWMPRAKAFRD